MWNNEPEYQPVPVANVATPSTICAITVQVPEGLKAGDSFPVSAPSRSGSGDITFRAIVPEGMYGGCFIDVYVPEDGSDEAVVGTPSAERNRNTVCLKKSTVGAAIAGGVVGVLLMGTVGGFILAGGAVAAASNSGKIGKAARVVGDKTFSAVSASAKWVRGKMAGDRDNHDGSLEPLGK